MKRTLQKVLAGGLVLVVLVVGGVWLLSKRAPAAGNVSAGGTAREPDLKTQLVTNKTGTATSSGVSNAAQARVQKQPGKSGMSAHGTNAEPSVVAGGAKTEDQLMAEKMHQLLDVGDEAGALALARKLMKSSDAGVRGDVVGVLGWIGLKAFPELSAMVGDADKAVASDALEQWRNELSEIQDSTMKAEALKQAMMLLNDQTELETLVMEFNGLPPDVAVRNLLQIIESGNPVAIEVARDHYPFLTGEPYKDAATAQIWLDRYQAEQNAQSAKK